MANLQAQRKKQAWAEKIAKEYGISPETVLGTYKDLVGQRVDDGIYITKKTRTEDFFRLYFDGVSSGVSK